MVQTAKEVLQVDLVDPVHGLSRHDCMQGRQRVLCSQPWTATTRARQKVLLVWWPSGRQQRSGGGRYPWVCTARSVATLQATKSCWRSSTVWLSLPGAVWRGT
jgi:hypothetical protein